MMFPTGSEPKKRHKFSVWVVCRPTADGRTMDRSYPIGGPILAASHTRAITSQKPTGG